MQTDETFFLHQAHKAEGAGVRAEGVEDGDI